MDQKSQSQLFIVGGAALVAVAIHWLSKKVIPSPRILPNMTTKSLVAAANPAAINWVRINYNGEDWDVASDYIAPVAVGDGEIIAKSYGADVPTAGLVDALWRAADLKLDPLPRTSDGTPKTMASQEAFDDQQARINAQIAGRPFTLLAGTHKDIVRAPSGKLGIYGWQKSDGSNIQPLSTIHYPGWIDYSQGVRLVRKVV